MITDLAARRVEQVEVFASATNEAVIRMVARQAPGAVRERDGATVTYSFPTPAGQLPVGPPSVAMEVRRVVA
ncbi:hypothetical protein GCM10023350_36810 [Nocardioides endophyticus]|uniref:Uncharacterized protein n=1 Tax=Nocardioides endophyticus TaxID=1353775 RepID=A0ABP8Z790_9ACTN